MPQRQFQFYFCVGMEIVLDRELKLSRFELRHSGTILIDNEARFNYLAKGIEFLLLLR